MGAGLPDSRARELERQLRKRCSWLKELKEMCEYIFPSIPCRPYATVALKLYRELAFAKLDELSIESIKRVIDACNVNVLLTDFAPQLHKLIMRLKRAAEEMEEEEERKEIARLAEKLREMMLVDFLANWEDVIDTLELYEYRDEAMDLYDAINDGRLTRVLEEELRRIAKSRGMNTEEILRELEY